MKLPRIRPPWHWRWGRILRLLLQCGAWWLAVLWSPFFAIPLAGWIAMNVVLGYRQPLPSPTVEPLPAQETAGWRVERKHNGALTTITSLVDGHHQKVVKPGSRG